MIKGVLAANLYPSLSVSPPNTPNINGKLSLPTLVCLDTDKPSEDHKNGKKKPRNMCYSCACIISHATPIPLNYSGGDRVDNQIGFDWLSVIKCLLIQLSIALIYLKWHTFLCPHISQALKVFPTKTGGITSYLLPSSLPSTAASVPMDALFLSTFLRGFLGTITGPPLLTHRHFKLPSDQLQFS